MKLPVSLCAACVLGCAWQAAAAARRFEPGPPTPLESAGFGAGVQASKARAASSDARSVVTEVASRLDAEAANGLAENAEASADMTKRYGVNVRGALSQALKAANGASQAAANAKAAYIAGTSMVMKVEQSAQGMVGNSITDKVAPILKQLQEWKMDVLHNPVKNGRAAGAIAAQPYDKALQVTEQRVAAYQQRAESLSNTARGLRVGASGLANEAVGKQSFGEVYQAQQDMVKAHEMMAQASALETQGLELQKHAQQLAVNVPAYMAASQTVSQRAAHLFNPKLAPPPMQIGAAAIMPPTNIT